jgi:hypothetical protein
MIPVLASALDNDQVSYRIVNPEDTHFRRISCEEADCEHQEFGWQSLIDESTELGQRQAHYIRTQSGRKFTEDRNPGGTITVFSFEAGQRCFMEHKTNVGKNPLFLVHSRTRQFQHTSAQSWADDLHTHQDKVLRTIEKG